MNMYRHKQSGFTLLEILVVIAIIGILTTMLTLNFNKARQATRDDARQSGLKELQLALELYKAQYGYYPAEGCAGAGALGDTPDSATNWDGNTSWTGPGPHPASWGNDSNCSEYIVGLVPDFIEELPTDPNQEDIDNWGYIYRVSADGSAYKAMVHWSVEVKTIDGYDNVFARCPRDIGSGGYCREVPQSGVYAVYSAGAENW